MPTLTFEEKAKKDFDQLVEKYGQVIFLADTSEKDIVSMNCSPANFLKLFEKTAYEYLKIAKENNLFAEMREMIAAALARACAKIEMLDYLSSKKKEKNDDEKTNFASDMMSLLFKSLFEDDDDDDDD